MRERRPFLISLIGYWYIFGAFLLLVVSLFPDFMKQFGVDTRQPLSSIETIIRVLISIAFIISSYGYLRLKRWGFWLMVIVITLSLSQQIITQTVNKIDIISVFALAYTFSHRKHFANKVFPL